MACIPISTTQGIPRKSPGPVWLRAGRYPGFDRPDFPEWDRTEFPELTVAAMRKHHEEVENPSTPFNVNRLARQVMEECVFPTDRNSPGSWGGSSEGDRTYCLSLVTRISAIVRSPAFSAIFKQAETEFASVLAEFMADPGQRLLRMCLSGVSYEFRAREFIANAIGRALLQRARSGEHLTTPLVVFVDEAHNFLGRAIGSEDDAVRLDAFELIAREGRKFGLNVCLATQRPRDLTEGVLSQMGTLIVHRLTNDRDREIVERACGEMDRSASAFLASLRSGEAAIIGVDFPIPLTVSINAPRARPESDGPNYQASWRQTVEPA